MDDYDPTYYTDFEINNGEALPSAVCVTPDGESIAIKFDSNGNKGINHRSRAIMKLTQLQLRILVL